MRKKVLPFLVLLVVVFAVPLFFACNEVEFDFQVGDFGYTINSDGENTVTLSKLLNFELENAHIPATVTHEDKTYTVTQIGSAVFAPVPSGVTLKDAFDYDSANDEANDFLKTVTFAEGSAVRVIGGRAFEKCKRLTAIALPASLEQIGGFAFKNCASLISITIPPNVKQIGDYAFENCTNLSIVDLSVTDPQNLPKIGAAAFKWFDKSKVAFSGGDGYRIIENLSITVASNEVLAAFNALNSSPVMELRNWKDYSGVMSVREA
jgi:hypothetical protein